MIRKKMSVKITVCILCILTLVIGSVSIFYVTNCKDIYIKKEKNALLAFSETLQGYDFEKQEDKIDEILETYDDKKYKLVIYDENHNPVYCSSEIKGSEKRWINDIMNSVSEFSNTAETEYKNYKSGYERVFIKKIYTQNDKLYYVYIEESLKTIDSVFKYSNTFLMYMIILYLALSGIIIYIFIKRITNSARELGNVVTEISSNNYSVRYTGKITDDELGVLATNFNHMADTIQEDINKFENYNFLLKEDINRMTEYDNMRKRVLSNITHELKTPLAIISSQIEMLSCVPDEEKKQYYFNSAMKEIDSMSKLISDLLNFSSGEKEIFIEDNENINLSKRINTLIDSVSVFFFSKGISYEKDIDKNCVLDIMPNHIDHVFNNYAMNAAHHVKKGGKIKITLHDIGNAYRLTVYNDGENISEENMKRIWSDFYKDNEVGNKYIETSGLGLFIVKEISIIDRTGCGAVNKKNGVEFWYDFKK